MSDGHVALRGYNVWCCATKEMVVVFGSVTPLANHLQELSVKECLKQRDCDKAKHGHFDCLSKKLLVSNSWVSGGKGDRT